MNLFNTVNVKNPILRMRNWCELVRLAVAAEVPNYEIMTSLAVFLDDLTTDQLGDDVTTRIAKFFNFDAETGA